jgi:DNA-binding MarR family transcriptional regulator
MYILGVYMEEITKAEIKTVLRLVKSPETEYNANSLANVVGITPMGALKILKRLEKDSILKVRKVGKAFIYRINAEDDYARHYVALLLAREARYSKPQIKRWVVELKKVKNAEIIILYGSILEHDNPKDIDVLVVVDKTKFLKIKKDIEEINKINIKKIHAVYQTFEDIVNNIKKRHNPILRAIKGIVVAGEEKFIGVYNESRKE